ncbi:hypothetical protein P7K49_005260 [Saguinus oedipus]|uniref:Uncharacterized protein n=1 Tax=Saguinus oedipus TaxID=9490 RepID=A0ABQ9WC72_SAGOE|nr:hypothetical protein P7K49_005260 [Saguinus oedipus]
MTQRRVAAPWRSTRRLSPLQSAPLPAPLYPLHARAAWSQWKESGRRQTGPKDVHPTNAGSRPNPAPGQGQQTQLTIDQGREGDCVSHGERRARGAGNRKRGPGAPGGRLRTAQPRACHLAIWRTPEPRAHLGARTPTHPWTPPAPTAAGGGQSRCHRRRSGSQGPARPRRPAPARPPAHLAQRPRTPAHPRPQEGPETQLRQLPRPGPPRRSRSRGGLQALRALSRGDGPARILLTPLQPEAGSGQPPDLVVSEAPRVRPCPGAPRLQQTAPPARTRRWPEPAPSCSRPAYRPPAVGFPGPPRRTCSGQAGTRGCRGFRRQ